MLGTRFAVSIFHFVLMVLMSGFVIFWTYRTFIRANPDFDMEDEIIKGNMAVGLLVGTILYCASQILMAGTDSSMQMLRMHLLAPTEENASVLGLLARMTGHLAISMGLAVVSISMTLRLRPAGPTDARGQGASEGEHRRRHSAVERRARLFHLY